MQVFVSHVGKQNKNSDTFKQVFQREYFPAIIGLTLGHL